MELHIKGKQSVLITGGTRGIGRAISIDLAGYFANTIFMNYVQNDTEAKKTAELVRKYGSKAYLLKANLMFPDEIDKMFNEIYSKTKSLDIFIHCAAINSFKPLIKVKPNQWDMTMNVNARSFLMCVQKCLPIMKKGKILAISSLGSRTFVPNYGAMGATKSALESMVRYLAVELAGSRIQVNGVTAGFVNTSSLTKFPNHQKMRNEILKRTPARRIGTSEDVSNMVMFLLSRSADWIYGQNIIVDGGISLT